MHVHRYFLLYDALTECNAESSLSQVLVRYKIPVCEQCRPISDVAEKYSLFAYRNFYGKYNKI